MTDLILLALLGGVLALDATSFGQFMISRPLVSGAAAGWALGDPATGLLVGAILETYLLVSYPSGGARFPDGTAATIVAVAAATSYDGAGALPLAIAFGLVWGRVGAWTVTRLRHLNGHNVPEPADADASAGRVARAHLAGLMLDFVRAATVTAIGVAASRVALSAFAAEWPLSPEDSRGLLLVGAAVSAGILLRDFGGFKKRGVLFVVGAGLAMLGAGLL